MHKPSHAALIVTQAFREGGGASQTASRMLIAFSRTASFGSNYIHQPSPPLVGRALPHPRKTSPDFDSESRCRSSQVNTRNTIQLKGD